MGFLRPHRPNDRTSTVINQQIQQNQRELEQRRASLYSQRLGIIKSQGLQAFGSDAAQVLGRLPEQTQKATQRIIQRGEVAINSLFPR